MAEPAFDKSHNRPPSPGDGIHAMLEMDNGALLRRRDELLAAVQRVPAEVGDQETAWRVADLIKLFMACMKSAEAERVATKEPYLESSRAVDGFFKAITEPLDKAKRAIEARLTLWQRKVAEAERRRREEAERIAREEAKRKRREAEAAIEAANMDTLGAAIQADEDARQAEADAETARKAAAATPAELSRERGELGSVASLRTFFDFADLDRATLDLEALRSHLPQDGLEKSVRSFIKAGGRELRGCRIFENTSTVVR